jgi:4-hydroxythreonine-4-phosphate dehydrogenase
MPRRALRASGQRKLMKGKVVIACGDPAGVGPEIAARWAGANPQLAGEVILAGPRSWLEETPELAPFGKQEVGPADFRILPGEPSEKGARVALEALEYAAEACRRGEARAVVTGPVSKLWMQKAGFAFPGQTEFFAARWGGKPVMAFGGGRLRVVLATWHVPLARVPAELTAARLERAIAAAERLAGLCGVEASPRIGVCGLNPHAGEGGILGREEVEWIDPLLDRVRESKPGLSQTQPGDTLFWRALQGEFDVVVALYHDQGLAPLKTIDFEESVNLTLGLPFLRTSPDHGTAFDIAGRGVANPRSFFRAVEFSLAGRRETAAEE